MVEHLMFPRALICLIRHFEIMSTLMEQVEMRLKDKIAEKIRVLKLQVTPTTDNIQQDHVSLMCQQE